MRRKLGFTPRVPIRSPESSEVSQSLCKFCDIRDWDERSFRALSGEIMNADPHYYFPHRKLWEFTKAVQALRAGGVWNEDSLGLSVAGGTERFLFYAANHVHRIVSADIYGEGDFAGKEAAADFLEDSAKYAPYPFRRSTFRAVRMNALTLEFPDDLFDFAVCFSSIEHFGGMGPARRAVEEMIRVVRPGGIVFLTTDVALNGICTNEVFRIGQMERLGTNDRASLMDPLDPAVSTSTLEHLLDMRTDNLDELPHMNLKLFGSVFTSFSLALRKNAEGEPDTQAARCQLLDRTLEELAHAPKPVLEQKSRGAAAYVLRKGRAVAYRLSELFI